MSAQLELTPDYAALGATLRRLLREVVDSIGPKEVAYDLDIAPSSLQHALEGRERHYVRIDWLPYLVRRAKTDEAVEFLAALRGLDVVERPTQTPEQELRALREAVKDSLGADLANAVLAKAKRGRR